MRRSDEKKPSFKQTLKIAALTVGGLIVALYGYLLITAYC